MLWQRVHQPARHAQIWDGKRVVSAGHFDDEAAAAAAYDEAALSLRGDRAVLNFPDSAAAAAAVAPRGQEEAQEVASAAQSGAAALEAASTASAGAGQAAEAGQAAPANGEAAAADGVAAAGLGDKAGAQRGAPKTALKAVAAAARAADAPPMVFPLPARRADAVAAAVDAIRRAWADGAACKYRVSRH